MPRVKFNIGKQTFDLACEEGEQGRIQQLAERLNERFIKLSQNFQTAPDTLVLAVTALMMEDEIESIKEKYQQDSYEQSQQSFYEGEQEKQQEVEQMVSDIIDPVTDYIEMLADKIESM